jgi:1-acyl-sn-glycerol-3-phosphate acyltransferase
VTGPIPQNGLLVSNHLSYLDVLVFSALTPAVFVAKQEVESWPVLGFFARLAGTVFVDRRRRLRAGASADAVETVLADGGLAVLFPEGTSSDGKTVLPFKSALLGPVATGKYRLWASAITYGLHDGDVLEEICYWKDMILLPHLLNVLSKAGVTAYIRFSDVESAHASRKELASRLHAHVLRLKARTIPDKGMPDHRRSLPLASETHFQFVQHGETIVHRGPQHKRLSGERTGKSPLRAADACAIRRSPLERNSPTRRRSCFCSCYHF